jgi:hypothetical protein
MLKVNNSSSYSQWELNLNVKYNFLKSQIGLHNLNTRDDVENLYSLMAGHDQSNQLPWTYGWDYPSSL